MFDLFKSKTSNKTVTVEKITVETVAEHRSEIETESIVKEIQNQFDLQIAIGKKRVEEMCYGELSEEMAYGKKLSELGFDGTEQSKAYYKFNSEKEDFIKALEYWNTYAIKYPTYKLIFFDDLLTVLKKYNLHMAPIKSYIGKVPKHNIDELEKFKSIFQKGDAPHGDNFKDLHICAPKNLLNTEDLKEDAKNRMFIKKDPIVVQPLQSRRSYWEQPLIYLIVTAWGPEAMDKVIFNEQKN